MTVHREMRRSPKTSSDAVLQKLIANSSRVALRSNRLMLREAHSLVSFIPVPSAFPITCFCSRPGARSLSHSRDPCRMVFVWRDRPGWVGKSLVICGVITKRSVQRCWCNWDVQIHTVFKTVTPCWKKLLFFI